MTAKEMASVKALQEAAIVKGDLRTAAEYAARIAFAESSKEEREECSLAPVKAVAIVARFEDSEDKEDLGYFFSSEWSRLVCENFHYED